MGSESGLARSGIPEVIPVLLGVGGIRSLGLETPATGGSQGDACLGEKSSICLHLHKEESRVSLHSLFRKAPPPYNESPRYYLHPLRPVPLALPIFHHHPIHLSSPHLAPPTGETCEEGPIQSSTLRDGGSFHGTI